MRVCGNVENALLSFEVVVARGSDVGVEFCRVNRIYEIEVGGKGF